MPVIRAASTCVVLRGFLALLRAHPDLIEADLSHFHQIDYRDRWRRDADGVRRLTLRMIHVRVRHLPATSALSLHFSNGRSVWDLHAHLLADLATAWTGQKYDRTGEQSGADQERSSRRQKRREASRKRARVHNNRSVAADIARAKSNATAGQKGVTDDG
ncbi:MULTISPECIES: hypothetical protein [Mycobacteriaceae]|uniref:hypothetical protein n=1 Tax=Mycobacteriaceae TaxID=1762 RepID=UPI002571153B|nr:MULTISPECIES: hypothetical protein [Mycobacteriaceae]MDO3058475.1 hypothetical protein [Mycobacteroides abscessus subsp. abscessus]MDO3277989.1 hypothetical protein [Mycobacteroides abscessus subsp. abscessus]